ncbi:hypothetical protein GGTG_07086 [Gaeumannomyces tritici R3-111a-1]|uniref:DUF6536 domain-containing protein n=1 Tax=Gaeumannomyces tritici (strain R3-111a-1) TaxID=644352 RepID=J3P0P1_GAET3|nr:hypothetical protein GGTG_07086 [Gaeumannomyces tritici R3-111a-1]EJT77174.1 hypothetical protein GGTG_07086 [Gaeumannomyces tritici R3-111a-1]
MEVVIPPRDHGASTYRYEWDENGAVTNISRVASEERTGSSGLRSRAGSSSQNSHKKTHNHGRSRGARQTVQWPFQSSATITTTNMTETTTPISPVVPMSAFHDLRRATWQIPGNRIRDSQYTVDPTIVPDYVANFIRGETPETLARKKNDSRLAERDVGVVSGAGAGDNRNLRSRAAAFDGFPDLDVGDGMHSFNSNSRLVDGSGNGGLEAGTGGSSRRRGGCLGRFTNGGWRSGVELNALLALLIFVVGLVCLVWAVASSKMLLGGGGDATVFAGSCEAASRVSWGLHALVNVLGLAVLAGANYVYQVLSSPDRAEVDAAHAKTKWLDIGIPSLRNLAHISTLRVLVALVLVLTAVLTQIIYNAVIFTSQTGVGYNLVVVSQPFLSGAQFSNASSNNDGGLSRVEILALQDQASRNQLVRMSTPDCLGRFAGSLEPEFRAVVMVTGQGSADSSLVQTRSPTPGGSNPDARSVSPNAAGDVQFCLAQRRAAGEHACRVDLNGSLLGVVALLNLITVIFTVLAFLKTADFRPLATLGDAVSSFLRDPDATTTDACLMTKTDVWQHRWGLREAKYWVPATHYWFQSASLPRWAFVAVVWAGLAGASAAALGIGLRNAPVESALSTLGSAAPTAVYALPASIPASAAALVAAVPQLLLGVLYLAVNALLTTMYLSHESSLHALAEPRPLRVSSAPRGAQTTSFYLTLPRPASWVLAALFAGMGFVLSQSVFVVAGATATGGNNASLPDVVALGFSGTGLLALLAALVVLAAGALGLGLRRAPAAVMVNGQALGNPLVLDAGSCSAVVSARCQPLRDVEGEAGGVGDEDADLDERPLCWGVVRQTAGMVVSHCTYSARGVERLDMSRAYA